ncbi:uracil-DNA glycosylase [Clostridium sp. CS001]|uniref:uracil-DNA glycosylase n=1 Tax=Clostridium sp. CS001 TaxID=2880648 RepID=UPI001CF5115A|nr:uracil-DNA glycosylase [Clostridium sp. CS001]MCB2291884.1 uracil-DNA glycosylase [Clostridium sp. CS001]
MKELMNDWDTLLLEEFNSDYYLKLKSFLNEEYKNRQIYPEVQNTFNAIKYTSYKNVKVVILGQDPYHGASQAHGLSFSVMTGTSIPPSLLNIYKELHNDLGCYIPNNGYLKKWADQGVLLLNTVLTVRSGEANSHKNIGWERFTSKIITLLNDKTSPLVFIFWGKNAETKQSLITNPIHHIIKSAHPSPLSAHRGFFNSKPFSNANNFLISQGKKPVDWQIENI